MVGPVEGRLFSCRSVEVLVLREEMPLPPNDVPPCQPPIREECAGIDTRDTQDVPKYVSLIENHE